jgi:hypothetical protein
MGFQSQTNADGSLDKRSVRFAARGDLMIPGVHYDPSRTAAQTPSHTAMRLFFATSALQNEHLESNDVPGAYARADTDPNFRVYMVQQPRSNGTYTVPDMVLRLDKAQQGPPDAGYRWGKHRNDTLRRFGRNVLKTAPAAYYIENQDGSKHARLLASTDDFVISSSFCIAYLDEQRNKFKQECLITLQFPVTQHAGINIVRTPKYIGMSAPKHIEALFGVTGHGELQPRHDAHNRQSQNGHPSRR